VPSFFRSLLGCCHYIPLLEKREQIGIDLVGLGCGHTMRKTRIHLKNRTLHQLRGLLGRSPDRYDLVIVAMKDQCGHIDLL
jgi:hypothetical protein